eukprot:CAMPEP_0114976550 /NCGR_PEP_ID=MMETSP0216-20121206/2736_1 /TAXON_ID=223996 /ORGANISM="Protocruzia adherens, Strain Boccale" /LENGTH=102 /DNA_ID=CAMNT_0002337493 /DNA_START=415 /DNA_END=719 /DNA_ORIENTATION=+
MKMLDGKMSLKIPDHLLDTFLPVDSEVKGKLCHTININVNTHKQIVDLDSFGANIIDEHRASNGRQATLVGHINDLSSFSLHFSTVQEDNIPQLMIQKDDKT